ncbi:zinc finger-like domain-containing protein [Methylobacterium flocculans]|uniref:zinc finger-like domain-containing protein n=1 Tax=Methylobacterium flocculans TaxID=2984843 RepID=UPI0021F2BF09|nr:zinc finger-like domain-containing protein [Methylobacterium sp. FF17]
MLAEPVFHDKHLIGNGETCGHCGGTGRTKGTRGPSTSRRCRPCKGSGRAPLPAEVIVANTRPAGRQAALVIEARNAREAAEVNALRDEVEAKAAADRKPIETICGFPLPVEFGRREDDTAWIGFGVPLRHHLMMDWPGNLRDASAFAQMLNGLPAIRDALKAVRADALDPDTDAALSTATGDLVETALRALGERL